MVEGNERDKYVDQRGVVFKHIEEHVQVELIEEIVHLTSANGLSGAFASTFHGHEESALEREQSQGKKCGNENVQGTEHTISRPFLPPNLRLCIQIYLLNLVLA